MLERIDPLLDRLFPETCAICEAPPDGSTWVCATCLAECPAPPPPLCAACGESCAVATARHRGPIVYAATRYADDGDTAGGAAIRFLKFAHRRRLARPLAMLILSRLRLPSGLFVPVPLHPRRLRERGFDQAQLLARHLARLTGRRVAPNVLHRPRATATQSRLGRTARRANTRGAFAAAGTIPSGAAIVLIDDVVTTGATIRACADGLRGAGVVHVTAVVVARSMALEASVGTR